MLQHPRTEKQQKANAQPERDTEKLILEKSKKLLTACTTAVGIRMPCNMPAESRRLYGMPCRKDAAKGLQNQQEVAKTHETDALAVKP
jgi:hypothetical protein